MQVLEEVGVDDKQPRENLAIKINNNKI